LVPLEPRPADLRAPVEGLDVPETGGAGRLVGDDDDEGDFVLGRERHVEPPIESERVKICETVDLGIALRGRPKPFSVPFVDRLETDDLALQWFRRPQNG
jgi:hypothetical protein